MLGCAHARVGLHGQARRGPREPHGGVRIVLRRRGRSTPRGLQIKYQAARAYEINAALDAAVEVGKGSHRRGRPRHQRGPTDEALSKFSWRTIQSAKYEGGERVTSRLQF